MYPSPGRSGSALESGKVVVLGAGLGHSFMAALKSSSAWCGLADPVRPAPPPIMFKLRWSQGLSGPPNVNINDSGIVDVNVEVGVIVD